MFCMYCGTKLADEAKFCCSCGKPVTIVPVPDAQPDMLKTTLIKEKVDFEGHIMTLPTNIQKCGQVYTQFYNLAQSKTAEYISKIEKENPSLRNFVIHSAEDVSNMFEEFYQLALDNLVACGIFNYNLQQVHDASLPYITQWPTLYDEFQRMHYSYKSEAQAEYQYREERKDSRGKVIGGGFGLKGAVKGMVTAGAVNAVTGAFHDAVNSIGDSMTQKRFEAQEKDFFKDSKIRNAIYAALLHDFNAIYYTFVLFYNKEKTNDTLPVFSAEDLMRAMNIEQKLYMNEIPQSNLTTAISKMLETFPISPRFYESAEEINSAFVDKLHMLSTKCGVTYLSKLEKIENTLKKYATRLCNNQFFVEGADAFAKEPFIEALDRIVESKRSKLGSRVHIITEKNEVTKNIYKMISANETPLLFCDTSITANCANGIVLTDKNLYGPKHNLQKPRQRAITELDIFISGDHLFYSKDEYSENNRLNNSVVSELIFYKDVKDEIAAGLLLNELLNFIVDWQCYQQSRISLSDNIVEEICNRAGINLAQQNRKKRTSASGKRTQRIDDITAEILASHFAKIQKQGLYLVDFFPCGSHIPHKRKELVSQFVSNHLKGTDELELFCCCSGLEKYLDVVLFTTKAIYIKEALEKSCKRLAYEEVHSMKAVKKVLFTYCYINEDIYLPCCLDGAAQVELCDDMLNYVIPYLKN